MRETWRTAIVPGTRALNKGGEADVQSVSCGSAGNCAAGGDYMDRSGDTQAFVASERDGTWRRAIEVPGTGALNTGGFASVGSVSCGSAGNCLAGGSYFTTSYAHTSGDVRPFVASERNGTWRRAIEVPGIAALNTGPDGSAGVGSVSCASAGNCVVGGEYTDSSSHTQLFVASERNGAWQTAIEVPGTGALNTWGVAGLTSVSCGSAGNCVVGGYYTDGSGTQAFVASERNGTWRTAIEVPGTGALTKAGLGAEVTSVSCASAGNCLAGGDYIDGSGRQAFVASERNGAWQTAIEVPGTGALNTGGTAGVTSVSCGSAGNCAVGGDYQGRSDNGQAFVASERNGTWRTAIKVPGTRALSKGRFAEIISVSCGSAGNCLAGGNYTDRAHHTQVFVASERNGTWRTAIEVPGTRALSKGRFADVFSVSCASAGHCAVGGGYQDGSGHVQAFVANQT